MLAAGFVGRSMELNSNLGRVWKVDRQEKLGNRDRYVGIVYPFELH